MARSYSHRKRNSLDTRAVFIEFLKYVGESEVVRNRGERSYTIASNSAEHLTGDDAEGMLTVIDSNIIAEPNDLGTQFAGAVSEIQDIHSETSFLCQNCRKRFKVTLMQI